VSSGTVKVKPKILFENRNKQERIDRGKLGGKWKPNWILTRKDERAGQIFLKNRKFEGRGVRAIYGLWHEVQKGKKQTRQKVGVKE